MDNYTIGSIAVGINRLNDKACDDQVSFADTGMRESRSQKPARNEVIHNLKHVRSGRLRQTIAPRYLFSTVHDQWQYVMRP